MPGGWTTFWLYEAHDGGFEATMTPADLTTPMPGHNIPPGILSAEEKHDERPRLGSAALMKAMRPLHGASWMDGMFDA